MTSHSTPKSQEPMKATKSGHAEDDPRGPKAWLWFGALWLAGFAGVSLIAAVVKGLIRLAM